QRVPTDANDRSQRLAANEQRCAPAHCRVLLVDAVRRCITLSALAAPRRCRVTFHLKQGVNHGDSREAARAVLLVVWPQALGLVPPGGRNRRPQAHPAWDLREEGPSGHCCVIPHFCFSVLNRKPQRGIDDETSTHWTVLPCQPISWPFAPCGRLPGLRRGHASR